MFMPFFLRKVYFRLLTSISFFLSLSRSHFFDGSCSPSDHHRMASLVSDAIGVIKKIVEVASTVRDIPTLLAALLAMCLIEWRMYVLCAGESQS